MNDTIAAIATPQAAGGIGIVRISGDKAIEIADKVFTAKEKKRLIESRGYSAHFGYVHDDDIKIDEAIDRATKAIREYLIHNFENAMSKYNGGGSS